MRWTDMVKVERSRPQIRFRARLSVKTLRSACFQLSRTAQCSPSNVLVCSCVVLNSSLLSISRSLSLAGALCGALCVRFVVAASAGRMCSRNVFRAVCWSANQTKGEPHSPV